MPPGTPHHAKCPQARHRHAKCITAHHKGRGGWEELKGLKYTSTETEAATDCRYLDYDSNPAMIQRGSKVLPEINAPQVMGIGPELTYFSISQYKR